MKNKLIYVMIVFFLSFFTYASAQEVDSTVLRREIIKQTLDSLEASKIKMTEEEITDYVGNVLTSDRNKKFSENFQKALVKIKEKGLETDFISEVFFSELMYRKELEKNGAEVNNNECSGILFALETTVMRKNEEKKEKDNTKKCEKWDDWEAFKYSFGWGLENIFDLLDIIIEDKEEYEFWWKRVGWEESFQENFPEAD